MFQEAQVSQGLVEVLAKAHVRGLKPEHHLAIAFRVKHHDFKGAPRVISYSESQTKRRWNEVQDFFLPILGLPRHDEVLTGIWIVLHASVARRRHSRCSKTTADSPARRAS
jgi:hypothetical protein